MVTISRGEGRRLPSLLAIASVPTGHKLLQDSEPTFHRTLEDYEQLLSAVSRHQSDIISRLSALRSDIRTLHSNRNQVQNEIRVEKNERGVSLETPLYEWSLKVVGHMPHPVCKGKYFILKVRAERLSDLHSANLPEPELELAMMTSDESSAEVFENMAGQPIFRGQTKSTLKLDLKEQAYSASFKVQITEVTSHYVNGWVRLLVRPVQNLSCDSEQVLIEPLEVTNVIVRAKEKTCRKFREREKRGMPQQRVKNLKANEEVGEMGEASSDES